MDRSAVRADDTISLTREGASLRAHGLDVDQNWDHASILWVANHDDSRWMERAAMGDL